MRDFNSVRSDLINHLKLSGEMDGKIYWYDGTVELLFEILGFLYPNTKEIADTTGLSDTNNYIPDSCKGCSNHPSNGGSGICNCLLGQYHATC